MNLVVLNHFRTEIQRVILCRHDQIKVRVVGIFDGLSDADITSLN